MKIRGPHPEQSEGRLRWRLVLACAIPLAVLGLVVVPRETSTVPRVVETPLASEIAADGTTLEIIRAEADESFLFDGLRKKHSSARSRWFAAELRRGYRYQRFEFDITTAYRFLDHVECRLETADCSALFLLLRLQDAGGNDLISEHFIDQDGQMKRLRWNKHSIFEKTEDLPIAVHAKPEPLYVVEVEDGSDGWIPGAGPLAFDVRDGRSVVIVPVFPRHTPTLKLRVTRIGALPPFEIEIPNPGHDPAGSPSWSPDPEPWEYRSSEASIAVTELGGLRISRHQPPIPRPKFRVQPHGDQPPEAYQIGISSIEDESGNRAHLTQFRLIPGTPLLRYHGTIRRNHLYQWSQAEVALVAEAVWSGGSGEEALDLLPDAASFGIQEMTLVIPSSSEISEHGEHGEWQISFNGQVPEANLPKKGIVMFLDGEESSSKSTWSLNGHAEGLASADWNYEYTAKWEGQIKTGQRVLIGMLPEIGTETFHATLPVPPEFQ